MKKKFIRISIFCLLLLVLTTALVACGFGSSGGGSSSKSYIIRIDSTYGMKETDFVSGSDNIITKPKDEPEKEGYDFVGWYSDEKCTKELAYGTPLSSNLTIYAKWKKKEFTVTFTDELATHENKKAEYGSTLTLEEEPTAQGYLFGGYFTDKDRTNAWKATDTVKTDITIYYKWTPVTYNITYVTNDGVLTGATTSYDIKTAVNLPTDCVKTGYQFEGWYTEAELSGEKVESLEVGTMGDKTFYAKYLCDQAELIVKSGSGVREKDGEFELSVRYDKVSVDFDKYFTVSPSATYVLQDLNEKAVQGITFSANEGDEPVEHSFLVKVIAETGKDVTYYFVVNQYPSSMLEVNFSHTEKGTDSPVMVTAGDKVTAQEVTPNEGYTFLYWATKEGEIYTEFDFNTPISENIELYSVFETIEYTVTYSLGYGTNGEGNLAVYTVEDAFTLSNAVPKYDDYTFVGWFDEEGAAVENIAKGTTGNKTFFAAYALKDEKDTYIDFSEVTQITEDEIDDYVTYFLLNRLTEVTVLLDSQKEQNEISKLVGDAIHDASVDGAQFFEGGTGIDWDKEKESWKITVTITYDPFAVENSVGSYQQTEPTTVHYSTGREEGFSDFAIDHIQSTILVKDSEQLVFAINRGYRPVFEKDSAVETLYNKAKAIVRSIVNDDMTDEEKALAFYDYIITETEYDHDTFDKVCSEELSSEEAYAYNCFYLEGVLNDKLAVCDGINKAYMLLCRIEGIPAIQVEGEKIGEGTGHAWNKIYIAVGEEEPSWYIVDCTSGNSSLWDETEGGQEFLSHRFFLITDAAMEENYQESKAIVEVAADTRYDYFANHTFMLGSKEYSYAVSSDEGMSALLNYLSDQADSKNCQVAEEFHFVIPEGEESVYSPFVRTPDGLAWKAEVTLGLDMTRILNTITLKQFTVDDGKGGSEVVITDMIIIASAPTK